MNASPCGCRAYATPYAYVDDAACEVHALRARNATLEANARALTERLARVREVEIPALHELLYLETQLEGLERDLSWGLARAGSPYARHRWVLDFVRRQRGAAKRAHAALAPTTERGANTTEAVEDANDDRDPFVPPGARGERAPEATEAPAFDLRRAIEVARAETLGP